MKITKKGNRYHTWLSLGKGSDGKYIVKHITAPTRKELQERADALRSSFSPRFYSGRQLTVREAVERYIEKRRASCSPKTIREYVNYSKTAFQTLMDRKIADLDDDMLQDEIDLFASNHSPKTVSSRWALIRSAVKAVDRNFSPAVELPPVKRQRLQMPEKDALMTLFREIEGKPMELPVLLACVCGLRRGEIAALDLKADVDYDRGLIHVNKDIVLDEHDQWVVKPPKSDAGNRLLPCPAWLLEKLRAASEDPEFRFVLPNTMTTTFYKYAKRYGIGCSFHGLRHYYASLMEAAGVPETYQMERMGHTTNYMLKRYQEYLKEKEIEVNADLIRALDAMDPRKK